MLRQRWASNQRKTARILNYAKEASGCLPKAENYCYIKYTNALDEHYNRVRYTFHSTLAIKAKCGTFLRLDSKFFFKADVLGHSWLSASAEGLPNQKNNARVPIWGHWVACQRRFQKEVLRKIGIQKISPSWDSVIPWPFQVVIRQPNFNCNSCEVLLKSFLQV